MTILRRTNKGRTLVKIQTTIIIRRTVKSIVWVFLLLVLIFLRLTLNNHLKRIRSPANTPANYPTLSNLVARELNPTNSTSRSMVRKPSTQRNFLKTFYQNWKQN
ncbi:hypothetical protein EA473_16870 [Natrarchaeobius chitinivorans]|uniref:Uncharacterized protein n=1 Tax=Natrarchaeobius chitinivorans TaxID=1679083 RepID=A0A3N6LXD6_NATCH|nr:hypothetical protein EA473_16870 [Natrarchaeobius chitinivorans]